MQQGLTETSHRNSHATNTHLSSTSSSQHGLHCLVPYPTDGCSGLRSRSLSPDSDRSQGSGDAIDIGHLDHALGRLNVAHGSQTSGLRHNTGGQRILEYESAVAASTLRQSPRPTLGFTVVKRPGTPSDGVQLTDFPNEILTHIISHLHPDSHGAVGLVSKRFYALVTTPYAWRTAFLRFFPGHDVFVAPKRTGSPFHEVEETDVIRSESRYFTRLTSLASWRSEYLLRTRLLRSVARGKPGLSK
jgi:hypothetical protein